MSWAKGMFEKPKRSRPGRDGATKSDATAGAPGGVRRKQDTLIELRWHLPLPHDGASAQATSAALCRAELSATAPPPRIPTLSQEELAEGRQQTNAAASAMSAATAGFQEVATGLRLRFYTVGEDERVILLLHDVGECSPVLSGLAVRLASHGYKVIMLDLRGHGDSAPSAEGQYSAASMAADVESFVTERDLYTRPLAVVGVGLGAAVGLAFASAQPQLVGVLVLAELSLELPPDEMRFHPAQAGRFPSHEHAAALLCSRAWVLKHMQWRCRSDGDAVVWRSDPHFFFTYSPEQLATYAQRLSCHLLVVHGKQSHRVSRDAAQRLCDAAALAASSAVFTIPKCGHHLMDDAPLQLRNAVLGFLLQCDAALLVRNKESRRPELLGIRPLPQYATLEQAMQALKPRPVPTAAMIEEELERLRVDDEASSDEDEYAHRLTGLAKEDPEYFGFVG